MLFKALVEKQYQYMMPFLNQFKVYVLYIFVGLKSLPDVWELTKIAFKRTTFKPESAQTNLLLPFFGQHFTHMFFKTDYLKGPAYTWGGDGVSTYNRLML